MGRHARMKRFKANDPFNPKAPKEKKTFLKPPKDDFQISDKKHRKNMNFIHDNFEIHMEHEKKSKNKYKKQQGETDYRHIQRLNHDIQMEIIKADNEIQQEPEKDKAKAIKPTARKLKHRERLKTKKQNIKDRQREKLFDKNEKLQWQDNVQFGEVVMAPPTLKSKPRKAGDKVGKNKNNSLLLASKFKQGNGNKISLARKQVLLDERDRVIQAYRDIKQQKITNAKMKS